MKALIIGGTGKVGSAVAAHLRAMGCEPVVAARKPGAAGRSVDLRVPGALQIAASRCDTAFLITPLGPNEAAIGVRAIDELRAAGVQKIVYLGIHNMDEMDAIPHFAAKKPIRNHLLSDGRSVMLAANFFFQNDLNILGAILGGGVYAMPVGTAGVYSVDCGDIGRAGARALVMDQWDGTAQPVCGAAQLTGPEMAETWSTVTNRPVIYPGDDIVPFLDGLKQSIPEFDAWMENDFRLMMEVTQSHGCPASDAEVLAAAALIGAPQRRYQDFVQETAGAHLAAPPA